ncbi:MAG: glycosyltransferase family 39 protein [Anaerolineales bacterium]
MAAQRALEPPKQSFSQGIAFYVLAAVWLIWAIWRGEWAILSLPESKPRVDPLTIRGYALVMGAALSLSAFLTFAGNRFTLFNVTLWFSGLAALVYALWLPNEEDKGRLLRVWESLSRPFWKLTISRWSLLVMAGAALAVFFRVYHLTQVPPEMFSDHAEKLLDVQDVLMGQTRIFFPRNTGREAIQMYLTAGIAKYLGTGLSFISLKIGTVLAGLLALPFIYFLGKEVSNRRTGFLAMVFAGIAYWPNVISRVGLRFPLYPLFAAPVLYFIYKGLRTSNRNDFILAGLALGIGLHGYSPTRFLPFVVVAAILVYLVHRQSGGLRRQAVFYLMIVALVALVVFLPLGRYALENPGIFNYRTMTRMGTLERPLPGPAWQIFLKNLWNALIMFFWSDGETWVHSVVYRPALDVVSAALLFIGTILILVRYLRKRSWSDMFLLLSVPLLMMPSILSLAFPNENPSLNRTGGALVPVFIIVAYGLDTLLSSLRRQLKSFWGPRVAWGLAILLLIWSSAQNFDLVFHQYYRQFLFSSWNTTELGHVIRSFADSVGTSETAWVVPYPYWVDTRLVGINAGYPIKDFALWPEDFEQTLNDPRAKLFLLKPEDTADVNLLKEFYPEGTLTRYTSKVETKDFLLFFVPSKGTSPGQ